jgi:hypothetical protein
VRRPYEANHPTPTRSARRATAADVSSDAVAFVALVAGKPAPRTPCADGVPDDPGAATYVWRVVRIPPRRGRSGVHRGG